MRSDRHCVLLTGDCLELSGIMKLFLDFALVLRSYFLLSLAEIIIEVIVIITIWICLVDACTAHVRIFFASALFISSIFDKKHSQCSTVKDKPFLLGAYVPSLF